MRKFHRLSTPLTQKIRRRTLPLANNLLPTAMVDSMELQTNEYSHEMYLQQELNVSNIDSKLNNSTLTTFSLSNTVISVYV
jgi:hypothetical protein